MTTRVPIGVKRLDELLEGGVPPRSTTLLFGPPYTGKAILSRLYLLAGLRAGVPGLVVLTDTSASEHAESLKALDKDVPNYVEQGLLHYLDMYSWMIGDRERYPNTEYVEGPTDLNAAMMAVNTMERRLLQTHETHRLVFDSVSTLIVHTNAQTAFRFLQLFLGRTRQAGATSLLLLERGIHQPNEVELVKHLTNGILELRKDEGKTQLQAEGFGVEGLSGWVDFHSTDESFEITGSFASGRIR